MVQLVGVSNVVGSIPGQGACQVACMNLDVGETNRCLSHESCLEIIELRDCS